MPAPPDNKFASKFSASTAATLLDFIAFGMPITYACAYVGLCDDTYRNWIAKADSGDPAYEDFGHRARKAEAIFIAKKLKAIDDAGEAKLAAPAQWRLEKRFPTVFGSRVKIEAEVQGAVLIGLSDAKLDELLEALDRARQAEDAGPAA